jgi:3-isopropylmalate/(R)-2-methylmalate dehydratase large subunit
MGARTAQVYLASPYTVAAAAVAGHIVDPREMLQ